MISAHHLSSAASTNATAVRTGRTVVRGWTIGVSAASARFLKLYNKAGAPTVGTDIPVITAGSASGGNAIMLDPPIVFDAGLSFAITTGAADGDTGAVGAGDTAITIFYGNER